MILLELTVLSPGSEVGQKMGNPQPFKAGQSGGPADPSPANNVSNTNNNQSAAKLGTTAPSAPSNGHGELYWFLTLGCLD